MSPQVYPRFCDVVAAATRLDGIVTHTPLVEHAILNEVSAGRVFLKLETLQKTGSFKFRGAFNRIAQTAPEHRHVGVVTYSSGNHAQAVAAAAQLVNMPSLILMPADAAANKINGTRAFGAEIRFYERDQNDREVLARHLALERGATVVPPYDDPSVIAGQGTVALEVLDQLSHIGATADVMLVPCSGGGLLAGSAIVMREKSPATTIFSVEPDGFDDTAQSLAAGRRIQVKAPGHSICDALLVRQPGKLTFNINQSLVTGGITVSDAEVMEAIRFAFRHLKLVVEPGGAVGLAAVLARKMNYAGRIVVVICTGGNVDSKVFCQAITQ